MWFSALNNYSTMTAEAMNAEYYEKVCQLPNTTEETVGARSQPGILAHEKSVKVLTAYIKEILVK